MTFDGNPNIGGTVFFREDIVRYDTIADTFEVDFDGSFVGLPTNANLDAIESEGNDRLISFTAATDVPGLGTVLEGDVVRFSGTSFGENATVGTFALEFVGAANGVGGPGEDLDSLFRDSADGKLVAGFDGTADLNGLIVPDEGLAKLDAPGVWSVFSLDPNLTLTTEDINGADLLDPATLLMTTLGQFFVPGLTGIRSDVVSATPLPTPTTYIKEFDGAANSLFTGINGVAADFPIAGPQPEADLRITKTDAPDPIVAGNTLIYTVTVTNDGPDDAENVMVTDTLPPGVTFVQTVGCMNDPNGSPTCNLGTITNSNSKMFTIEVTVDTSTSGLIANTSTVTSTTNDPNTANNSATAETTVNPPQADLTITKMDSPDPVLAGQNITYTIEVTNAGPQTAENVQVTDTLPAGTTLISTTGCAEDPNGVPTCTLGDIGSGMSKMYTIVASVDSSVTGALANFATVTSDTDDPIPGNNSANATTTVDTEADLVIAMTDNPDPVIAGNQLTYTITVTNGGPSDAQNVVVTDTLPAGVTFDSTSGCSEDPNGVPTCTLGTIAAGASKMYTITVDVDAGTLGPIMLFTSAAAGTFDAITGDNMTSETTTVNPPPTGTEIYMTWDGNPTVDGILFGSEDIAKYDVTGNTLTKHFDGDDVLPVTANLDMIEVVGNTIYMSFKASTVIGGLGTILPGDIVRFDGTSFGHNSTSGTFSLFFEGAPNGVSGFAENVDSGFIDPADGKLVVGFTGTADLPGLGLLPDEGLAKLDAPNTWSLYSLDPNLELTSEDMNGADITNGNLWFTTFGQYFLPALTGTAGSNVVSCTPSPTCTTYNEEYNGPANGVFTRANGLSVVQSPLHAAQGEGPGGADVASLTQDELSGVVGGAIERYERAGASSDELDLLSSLSFAIVDLSPGQLGAAGSYIAVDVNGAGYGWFVDATPDDNSEFDLALAANSSSEAAGRMDLLTVVMHEMGHVLGRGHSHDDHDLMGETLEAGTRKLLDHDAHDPDSVDHVFGEEDFSPLRLRLI